MDKVTHNRHTSTCSRCFGHFQSGRAVVELCEVHALTERLAEHARTFLSNKDKKEFYAYALGQLEDTLAEYDAAKEKK